MCRGQTISHQLAAEVEPKVDKSLHEVISGVLDRVALDDEGAMQFASLGSSPDAWNITAQSQGSG